MQVAGAFRPLLRAQISLKSEWAGRPWHPSFYLSDPRRYLRTFASLDEYRIGLTDSICPGSTETLPGHVY